MQPMPGMEHGAPSPNDSPSTADYRAAMEKMHHDMDIPYTGNADRDFVAGMIPHHQGAIDMARVELRYGKDPALKRLAREIVAAQEKEIAFMRQWQARHAR
jgi:uncharacterized protein (DUF305 family)